MAPDNNDNINNPPSTPPKPPETPVPPQMDDLDAINAALDKATSNLVSQGTADKIAEAKEQARLEAAKEFATNQKIKELQEALAKQESERIKEKEAMEQKSAEALGKLKEQLDGAIASRATVNAQSPFGTNAAPPQAPVSDSKQSLQDTIEKYSDEEIYEIERASRDAMLNRVVKR